MSLRPTFALRGLLRAAASLLLFTLLASSAGAEALPTARIGVLIDGPQSRESHFLPLFKEEMRRVAQGAFEIEFPAEAERDGAWNSVATRTAMNDVFGQDLDAVVALGIGVAAEVCSRGEIGVPVVVPFALGDCSVRCSAQPGFRVRTLDLTALVERDLEAFQEIMGFDHVTLMLDSSWPTSCSAEETARAVAPEGATVQFQRVPPGDHDPLASLPSDTDAVYLMPLQQLKQASFEDLVARLTEHGLPTFSMFGESEVDRGVLAGLNTREAMASFARGAALEVLDMLEGRTEGRTTSIKPRAQLTLNMATAEALGFSPSWELRTKARLLHDESSRARPIDLETAMRRAVEANLDVLVLERRVIAGDEEIRLARSAYLPHVDLALSGVGIDDNHAIGALGQYSRYAAGSLTLTQLLYSDAASANKIIQRELHEARKKDWGALRLDLARSAVAAYTAVLSTDALIEVRQEQVDLTRKNLELAELRRSAEIYRWEAELATARAGLLEALAANKASERQLSRLLDEDLTISWQPTSRGLDVALEALGGAEDAELLSNPDGYAMLIERLLEATLERSPELAALESVLAAQERVELAARRASYLPSIGLQADLSHILAKDDTGGLDLGDIGDIIPELDDTAWQVAIQASLPLVTGGANKARSIQASEELAALRLDLRNAQSKLAQRTLSSIDAATASFSTLSLRREAADAALRTQELVQDAYSRGAASILDLLDAQNNALNADLAATISVYDFLDDWAEVRRAVAGGLPANGE